MNPKEQKNAHFRENKEKWTYETSKNDFIMMSFILIWLKMKKILLGWYWIPLYMSINGPIILQNFPILSPSESDQLIQVIRRIWAPFDSPRFIHRNLTCFKSGVSHFFQQYHYLEIVGGLGHFRTVYVLVWIQKSQCFFQYLIDCRVILFFSDFGLIIRGSTAARAN